MGEPAEHDTDDAQATMILWPQPLGRAVTGPLLGAELEVVASSLLPWREIRDA
jgi:hypothetical protein